MRDPDSCDVDLDQYSDRLAVSLRRARTGAGRRLAAIIKEICSCLTIARGTGMMRDRGLPAAQSTRRTVMLESKKPNCPDCDQDRREFMVAGAVGLMAMGALGTNGFSADEPKTAPANRTAKPAEALIQELF